MDEKEVKKIEAHIFYLEKISNLLNLIHEFAEEDGDEFESQIATLEEQVEKFKFEWQLAKEPLDYELLEKFQSVNSAE